MTTSTHENLRPVELRLEGMTCASCAARIEKKLNKVDGVSATVNYATETAHIMAIPTVEVQALIAAVEAAGYGASEVDDEEYAHTPAALGWRVILALVLGLPVIAVSMIPALADAVSLRYLTLLDTLGLSVPLHHVWGWPALILVTPVVFIAGWPIHRAAWRALIHGSSTMDTLISMGVFAAYGWSIYSLISGVGHLYVEVAAAVTAAILAGRYLEARAKRRAGSALQSLLSLGAKEANVLRDGEELRIPIGQLVVGDLFIVRPGEKVATDGVIVEGSSAIDMAMLTGESLPVDVSVNDEVVGATINTTGRLLVRATKVGASTELARIARLVTEAQAGKAPVQRLADRISSVFVPVVILIALATFVGWFVAGADATSAIGHAITVLIIACPCALGLATPTAIVVSSGRGSQLGVLIRGPEVLERVRRIDAILMDKTGTVTTGEMTVHAVTVADTDLSTALTYAAALESHSEHPIARAITHHGVQNGARPVVVTEFESTPGAGVAGKIDGIAVLVGSPQSVRRAVLEFDPTIEQAITTAHGAGRTIVIAAWDGRARAAFAVGDSAKPESARAIAALKNLGLEPWLLTGDAQAAAESMARTVGIDHVVAEVRPEEKVAAVERLKTSGKVVAMVGDGVNDSAALAAADLGMAMGTGTDAAINAADITLVRGDLRSVADAVRLSRTTLRIIKQNLFWAFAYNVIGIPIAAAGLLDPMYAGVAMAASSLLVVSNALRLRRFQPLT